MSNDQWDKDQRATAWNKDEGATAWNGDQSGTPWPSNGGDWNQGGESSATQNWDASTPQADPSQQQGGAWAASPNPTQNQPGQTQPSAAEWNTGAQPQPSAGDWTSGAQQQPSAGEWQPQGQQRGKDWNQAGQSQQNWNQPGQPQQDWNQGQPQQGWNQGQGQFAPGQQYAAPPARSSSGLGNIFDFSFRKFALPEASAAIYLIVVIASVLWFLVNLISAFAFFGQDFGGGAGFAVQTFFVGLVRTVLIILATRVVLEAASAVVRREKQDREIQKP